MVASTKAASISCEILKDIKNASVLTWTKKSSLYFDFELVLFGFIRKQGVFIVLFVYTVVMFSSSNDFVFSGLLDTAHEIRQMDNLLVEEVGRFETLYS